MIYYNLSLNFIQSVLSLFLRMDKIYLITDKAVAFHYNLKNHSFEIVRFLFNTPRENTKSYTSLIYYAIYRCILRPILFSIDYKFSIKIIVIP